MILRGVGLLCSPGPSNSPSRGVAALTRHIAETPLEDARLKGVNLDSKMLGRLVGGEVYNVGDLALVNVDVDEDRTRALAGCDKHSDARKTLWKLKRAAALLFKEELNPKPPKKNGTGLKARKRGRTTEQQQALAAVARWEAQGTDDTAFVADYVKALVAIARRHSDGGRGAPSRKRRKK